MGQRSHLVVVSGGLDSTVLAYWLARERKQGIEIVSFHYGQRHAKEIAFAKLAARRLAAPFHLIRLTGFGQAIRGSALTDSNVDVPEGHYEAETMKQTIVPHRNLVMLSMAAAIAQANGVSTVCFAAHAGDHAIYPDCRNGFVLSFQQTLAWSYEDAVAEEVRIGAPFLTWRKEEIIEKGAELDVPFDETWSCYKGGSLHCGRCGTCVERREAFQLAGVPDPTQYEK